MFSYIVTRCSAISYMLTYSVFQSRTGGLVALPVSHAVRNTYSTMQGVIQDGRLSVPACPKRSINPA